MRLTQKQEAFCQAYIETGNASEAYRRAYNTSKMKPETVNRKAKSLMDKDKIGARLTELRAPAIKAAQITLEKHLATLAELRNEARNLGQMSAAINAEVARGKSAGLYVTRQEITGKEGGPVEVKEKSEYDLTDLSEGELILCEWLIMRLQGVEPGDEQEFQEVHDKAQALLKIELPMPKQNGNASIAQ